MLVSLQPILTGALAGPLLGEQVTFQRWAGLVLGFAGAALVLGLDVGGSLPLVGFVASMIALLGVTSATLWQKKQGGSLPLPVSNFWQAGSACLFHLLVLLALEPEPVINFTARFVWAMGWQIIAVSFRGLYHPAISYQERQCQPDSLAVLSGAALLGPDCLADAG